MIIKKKDLIKEICKYGARKEREGKGHEIWVSKRKEQISIPRHREIKEATAKSIIKIAKGSQ